MSDALHGNGNYWQGRGVNFFGLRARVADIRFPFTAFWRKKKNSQLSRKDGRGLTTNLLAVLHRRGCGSEIDSNIVGPLAKGKMNLLINLMKNVFRGLGDLSPSCKTVSRLQSGLPEYKTRPVQWFGFRLHLAYCKWCRRYGKQISVLRSMPKELSQNNQGLRAGSLSTASRERIKRMLRYEAE